VEVTASGQVRNDHDWSILFHTYTALFALSYGVKSLYFMFGQDPSFALWRYPRLEDLPWYSGAASTVALLFWMLTWMTYRYVHRWLQRRPAGHHRDEEPNIGPVIVGLIAIAAFFAQQWDILITKITAGTIFYRNAVATVDEYESGTLGVAGLALQIEICLAVCLAAFAIRYRKPLLLVPCAFFFLGQAAVSDGSRFSLLSSLGFIPALFYSLRWKKPSHKRYIYPAIYVASCALPLLAAPLLVLRSESRLPVYAGSGQVLQQAGLNTFDSLDHLINYLYCLPIDYTGTRAIEEFLYWVPRAIYRDKPFLYGLNALQEVVYPGTLGAEYHHHLFGMYPLGCVVMGIDMVGPIGFVLHGCAIGATLAVFDSWISGRSFVRHAMFVFNFFFLYHIIRGGILHYLIGAVGGCFLPAMFCDQSVRIARLFSSRALLEPPPLRSR
jgi:hypothetical protein